MCRGVGKLLVLAAAIFISAARCAIIPSDDATDQLIRAEALLSVDACPNLNALKRAYYKAARAHHPDTAAEQEEASALMAQVNAAYEHLSEWVRLFYGSDSDDSPAVETREEAAQQEESEHMWANWRDGRGDIHIILPPESVTTSWQPPPSPNNDDSVPESPPSPPPRPPPPPPIEREDAFEVTHGEVTTLLRRDYRHSICACRGKAALEERVRARYSLGINVMAGHLIRVVAALKRSQSHHSLPQRRNLFQHIIAERFAITAAVESLSAPCEHLHGGFQDACYDRQILTLIMVVN